MVWWVPLATMAFSAISSGIKGKKAQREADKVAAENARLIRRENLEDLRRMDRTQALRMGSAVATIGSRNIMRSGSAKRVLADLEGEYKLQREYTQEVGGQREKMAREGSVGAGDAFKYQAQSSFISAGIGLAGKMSSSGSNLDTADWWK